MLETGNKAPEFTLQDQEGREVSLKDFRGKKYSRMYKTGLRICRTLS